MGSMATRFGAALLAGLLAAPAGGATGADGAAAAASIAPLESVLLMALDAEVAIDAAGRVTAVTIATPVQADLRAGVERVVRDWTFEPTRVDGVAVPARAKARIVVGSAPTQRVTRVWVDGVTFTHPPDEAIEQPTARIVVDKQVRPGYPDGVGLAGVKGVVHVGLRIGLDGRVAEAAVVRSALLDVNGRKAVLEDALGQFEAASLRAGRKFRFEVAVRDGVTPSPDDLTVIVPFGYYLGKASVPKPGEWRLHVRTPRHDLSWMSSEAKARLAGEAPGDAAAPAGSRLRLLSALGQPIAL